MENQNNLPLGGPAWLRAIADDREEMLHQLGAFNDDSRAEEEQEIQGFRDAANRMIKLELALVGLNQRVHSDYDFNADPDKMTLRVSLALS
jgi:hypothetical protein